MIGGMGALGGGGNKGFAAKPRAVACYICGREFGTASIEIHLKSCKKKWIDNEAQKPKHQRRPLPQEPAALKGGGIDYNNLDAFNSAVQDNYNKNVLVPCGGCGRTFLPESLAKHIKGCKAGAQAAEKAEYEATAKKQIVRPRTLVCHICGREFGTKSLEIHVKTCKKKWEYEQQ